MRKISEEKLQQIISYLSKQPYMEVFRLMQMLLNLPAEETKNIKDKQ